MDYKSKDPGYYTEQLKRAFINDLSPEEFNARSKHLIDGIRQLSSPRRIVTPRYCFPAPSVDFFARDTIQEPTIEDVHLFHGESHQAYRLRNSVARHTEPSRVLHGVVKTSLEGQVGFAFVSPEIHLSHFEAVFVPLGRIPLLHTWTLLH